jgi:hypothetical protein
VSRLASVFSVEPLDDHLHIVEQPPPGEFIRSSRTITTLIFVQIHSQDSICLWPCEKGVAPTTHCKLVNVFSRKLGLQSLRYIKDFRSSRENTVKHLYERLVHHNLYRYTFHTCMHLLSVFKHPFFQVPGTPASGKTTLRNLLHCLASIIVL